MAALPASNRCAYGTDWILFDCRSAQSQLGEPPRRRVDPLCTTALRNRHFASCIEARVLTLLPPPDWPKIVTFPGSPPKFAMLSRTHSSAANRSRTPAFAEAEYLSPYATRFK